MHSIKRQKVSHDRSVAGRDVASLAGTDAGVSPSEMLRINQNNDPVHNTFGLEKEAEKWLCDELQRRQDSYLKEGPQYTPFACSKNGKVPVEQFEKAFLEFYRRFGNSTSSDKTPSVLLVATGVSEEWTPGEDIGRARFLLFPKLGASNKKTALFMTYMPGPEHGAAGACFADQLGAWRRSNATVMKYLSAGGLSSGGYGHFQPDRRVFPLKKFRDMDGRDTDEANKGNPYSRFIWEIEYDNRESVQIRERGKLYMAPQHTRLFLAAKFYTLSDDRTYEAAIVLWGKADDNSNLTTVMYAISFGTKDLSDEHKNEFSEHRGNRLVGVQANQWQRPQDDPTAWTISVPFRGFLYKVTKKKRKRDRPTVYVLDDLADDEAEDLTIDLREIAVEYENQVVPQELESSSASEGE